MARPRSEHYETVQTGILTAAAKCFATLGYERSSVSDLVRECNASRGTLYHYFESKEAILYSLLRIHVSGLLAKLQTAAGLDDTPVTRLRHLVETIVAYNAASPHEQVILLNDLGSLAEREQDEIRGLEQAIVDLFASALAAVDVSGRITPRNRKVYTMMLLGIINFAHTWYDPTAEIKPELFGKMTCDVFLNGFLSRIRKEST